MKRERRDLSGGLSETAWAILNDKEPPADGDTWEALELSYPTVHHQFKLALWLKHREVVLDAFIAENPGRRPSWWWWFDPKCPRVSAEDIERFGWQGAYWLDYTCDLRRRLGGVGTPRHEVLNYAPHFHCGIPDSWMTAREVETDKVGAAMDPADPPKYESQPTFLARHGLLAPYETRRLKPKDFEPEAIAVDDLDV